MNYRTPEETFRFSEQTQAVYQDLLHRIQPNRVREMTITGPESDGKTPMIDVFEETGGEAFPVRVAKAIVRSWIESPVILYPGEKVVGVPRPQRVDSEHFSWGIMYHPEYLGAEAYKNKKQQTIRRYEAIAEEMSPGPWDCIGKKQEALFGSKEAVTAANRGLWYTGGYQGHTVPSYQKLLNLGLPGLSEEIKTYRKINTGKEAQDLYDACDILIAGLKQWMLQYAEEAEKQVKENATPGDKARLLKIADTCKNLTEHPPRTLAEAVQLMWFYLLWDWADCVGRADRYLLPFFEKEDSNDAAEDLIAGLWLKMYEHGIHNVTLGGVDPKTGKDSSNRLTFLMLQICRTVHDTHPRVSVRLHKNSPDELYRLIVKMWQEGLSDPSIVSDENVVKSLQNYGVSEEDARDYTVLGCQEIEIPGKSNFGCEDGKINLAKILELTLNDGKCRLTGQQLGLKTGRLPDYKTYEDLFSAYKKQVEYLTEYFIRFCNDGAKLRAMNLSKLVKTLCTDDCLKKGISLDAGGARYNYGVAETAGLGAVADSLTAIKTLVYEEKKISAETLENAMAANFKGFEKERQMLLVAPKYGNDNDRADQTAHDVLFHFWNELGKYKSFRGDVYTGACSLLEDGIAYGKNTWALPDGRFAGEPLGNSIGPRTGSDTNGTTAMLNSVMKMPLSLGVGGTTLNVTIPAETLKNEESRSKTAAMIRTYIENGGQMAQITTASIADLKDAQKHPEQYKNLIVRIGGFSIFFVELGEDAQNEIIGRYSS